MELEDIPEPDRREGVPHPRDTARVFGHATAEQEVLSAVTADRVHHAWLITGPRGIGKATFAWRMARYLLATGDADQEAGLFGAPPPPESLDIDPEHPVARRMRALSEQGLFLLRRPWDAKTKKLKTQITADETRRLKSFFAMSTSEGGRRVVLVDAADDMNATAANAVLKVLEEPPARAVLLLVCHQASALLPTIRSRCRTLKLAPLGPEDLSAALTQAGIDQDPETATAVSVLAAGSVGAAVHLIQGDGTAQYGALVRLMHSAPRLNRPEALAFAASVASRDLAVLSQSLDLIDLFLARLARAGAVGPTAPEAVAGEAELFTRLAPHQDAARHWAALHQNVMAAARRSAAANLDPAALILDTVLKINAGAERLVPLP